MGACWEQFEISLGSNYNYKASPNPEFISKLQARTDLPQNQYCTEKHLIVAGACPGQSRKNKWLRLYFRIMPRGLAIIRGIISYIKNSILFSALATSYFIGVWAQAPGEPLGPGPRGTLGPGPQGEPLGPGTFFGHVFRAGFQSRFFQNCSHFGWVRRFSLLLTLCARRHERRTHQA